MEIAVTTQLPTIDQEELREALQTALRNESELARAARFFRARLPDVRTAASDVFPPIHAAV